MVLDTSRTLTRNVSPQIQRHYFLKTVLPIKLKRLKWNLETEDFCLEITCWFYFKFEDQVSCMTVQFKLVSVCLGKPTCAPPHLSEVSPTLSLKRFQCSSDWRWPSLVLSRKIIWRFLFPHLSPPGNWWCDVFGCVPTGSTSSSSTLQTFRDANHLWWLLCLSVYLLGHFCLD